MGYMIGKVKIGDKDQFLGTFTTRGKEKRAEHNSRGARAFQNVDDPSEVIVVFDWDREDAEGFLNDPETQEIMQAAGLQGPPESTFVELIAETES